MQVSVHVCLLCLPVRNFYLLTKNYSESRWWKSFPSKANFFPFDLLNELWTLRKASVFRFKIFARSWQNVAIFFRRRGRVQRHQFISAKDCERRISSHFGFLAYHIPLICLLSLRFSHWLRKLSNSTWLKIHTITLSLILSLILLLIF